MQKNQIFQMACPIIALLLFKPKNKVNWLLSFLYQSAKIFELFKKSSFLRFKIYVKLTKTIRVELSILC